MPMHCCMRFPALIVEHVGQPLIKYAHPSSICMEAEYLSRLSSFETQEGGGAMVFSEIWIWSSIQ